jgi:hypothetical protein
MNSRGAASNTTRSASLLSKVRDILSSGRAVLRLLQKNPGFDPIDVSTSVSPLRGMNHVRLLFFGLVSPVMVARATLVDDFALKPLRRSPQDEDFHDLIAERYKCAATDQ